MVGSAIDRLTHIFVTADRTFRWHFEQQLSAYIMSPILTEAGGQNVFIDVSLTY